MKLKSLLILFTILFLHAACSDNSNDVKPEIYTTNKILSFTFEKSQNEAFLKRYCGCC